MKSILDQFKLDGRKAVVTGASGGIGRAVAIALAQAGADVAVHYHGNREAAEKTAAEIAACGREAYLVQADVSDYADVNRMAADVAAHWGRADILFNNAGVVESVKPELCTEEQWRKVIDVDLNGVFFCAQAFGKLMIQNGGGAIINTGSMSAEIINRPPEVAYSAAKAGVHLMTKGLAASWAKYNIRVNAIAPGYVETEMSAKALRGSPEWVERFWTGWTPMRRVAKPEELAGLVVYMASEAASFMTGACVLLDGGFTVY